MAIIQLKFLCRLSMLSIVWDSGGFKLYCFSKIVAKIYSSLKSRNCIVAYAFGIPSKLFSWDFCFV